MKLEEMLKVVRREYQIYPFDKTSDGVYRFNYAGVRFSCFEGMGKIHWCGTVCELPEDPNEKTRFLERYMKLAFAYTKRHAVTLTVEQSNLCLFKFIVSTGVEYSDFEQSLEEFLNAMDFFTQVEVDSAHVSRHQLTIMP